MPVCLYGHSLTVADIDEVMFGRCRVVLAEEPGGVGQECDQEVEDTIRAVVDAAPGDFSLVVTRAAMLVLANRHVALDPVANRAVIERLLWHLNSGITPLLPWAKPGVAENDILLHCHVTSVLFGRGRVVEGNTARLAKKVLSAHSLTPVRMSPEVFLNLINETSFSLAVVATGVARARRLVDIVALYLRFTYDGGGGGGVKSMVAELWSYADEIRRNAAFSGRVRPVRQRNIELRRRLAENRLSRPRQGSLRSVDVLRDALSWTTSWLEPRINFPYEQTFLDEIGESVHGAEFLRCGHSVQSLCALKRALASVTPILAKPLLDATAPASNASRAAIDRRAASREPVGARRAVEYALSRSAEIAAHVQERATVSCDSNSKYGHHDLDVLMIDAREALDIVRSVEEMTAINLLALFRWLGLDGRGVPDSAPL